MAFNVKKVIQGAEPATVHFPDGSKLEFRYRPYAYTPNHEDAVDLARDEQKAGATLKAMLIPLIESWDVVDEVPETDDKGEPVFRNGKQKVKEVPVPINMEGFGCVPIKALNMIMERIIDDMQSGEKKSTTSEGSFG